MDFFLFPEVISKVIQNPNNVQNRNRMKGHFAADCKATAGKTPLAPAKVMPLLTFEEF